MPGPDRREVDSIGSVLTTPSSCFAEIVDYPWPASQIEVGSGLRMAYVDAGPADATETVLLLHGEPTWGYLYRSMIPTLLTAGFRVIVPDLIGFGRSDKPVDPAVFTYSNHVAWVRTLIEGLSLDGITFFGQDWGGLIGGRVIGEIPDRFARLVFSNTGLPRSGPGVGFIRAQQPLDPQALRDLLGLDWRDTVDDDDRIDPARVRALVESGPTFYFLAWRTYLVTAIDRFGRLDAAIAFTGRIVVRRFLRSTLDDLREAMVSCLEAPTCPYAAWCWQWSIGVDDRSCCFARWEPSSSRDSTRCANAANRPPVSVRAIPRRSCWSVAGRAAACPDDPLDPSARGLTSTGPSIESLAAASGPSRRRGSPGRDADHAGRVAPHVARTR